MSQICRVSEKNYQGDSSQDGATKDVARSGEGVLLLQTQGAGQNFAGSALCQVKKPRVLKLLSESTIFTPLIKGSTGMM